MTLPRNIDGYLTRRFFDPTKPASFTSVSKLHQAINWEGKYDISLERIKEWAERQDILSLHKQVRQSQPKYRKIIAPSINHLLDVDLMVLNGDRFKSANSGNSYILITIDVFSRFCRARAVKSKSGKDISHAFDKIFDQMGASYTSDDRQDSSSDDDDDDDVNAGNNVAVKSSPKLPLYIRSDGGTEFTNRQVQELFKLKGIKHFTASTETKAGFSEIAIKTLKKKLFQHFHKTSSYNYTDILQDIISSYNNTVHSSIGVTPSSVTDENTQKVWDYQYITQNTKDLDKLFRRAYNSSISGKKKRAKYSVGDKVRVSYKRAKLYHRAFDQQFSSEIFTIRARKLTDGIFLYYLNDFSGSEIRGTFYTNELTPVALDPKGLFKIDRVIKTRVVSKGRKKVQESLVRYQGWASKYDQWIPSSSLKTIGKRKK